MVGWLRIPIRTVASHSGTAIPMFIDSCVVGVKVYGSSPSIFNDSKKIMRDSRIVAHLCPGLLIGVKSCFVNNKKAQVWMVIMRLGVSRLVEVKNKSEGRTMANTISGTPRIWGLRNWSKKFKFMVSFMGLYGVLPGLVLLGCL